MRKELRNRKYVVYVHTNLINGKVYIGQSCDYLDRWRCNGKNYFQSIKFYNAIKKYGWSNFSHEILYADLNKEDADEKERLMIAKYNSIDDGYNLKSGGSHGDLSQDSLCKMSQTLRRGYIEHPERRKKISDALRGSHPRISLEHKKGLCSKKSILITINGDTGSIRYWASKIGMTHPPLLRWLKLKGMDYLIQFIKERLSK